MRVHAHGIGVAGGSAGEGAGQPVRTLEVLPEEERRQVLYEWNETGREYPRDKCIHELFEEQVSGRRKQWRWCTRGSS